MNLSSRVAIVTGSGCGIGRAIALKLAEVGATIVINDIDEESVNSVVEEIKAMNGQSLAVLADVSSSSDVDKMVETVISICGRVDILVNNAGIARDQLVLRMSDEDWDKVMNVNLKSVFLSTRAVLRYMIRHRWGSIVNIASIVGIMGNAGQANYASAKAGIIAFTKTLAKELGKYSINVNCISPGVIGTNRVLQTLPEDMMQKFNSGIPLRRLGEPEEVAQVALFLASDESRYITGENIVVDGGMTQGTMGY